MDRLLTHQKNSQVGEKKVGEVQEKRGCVVNRVPGR